MFQKFGDVALRKVCKVGMKGSHSLMTAKGFYKTAKDVFRGLSSYKSSFAGMDKNT